VIDSSLLQAARRAALLCTIALSGAAHGQSSRPNIVMILSDDAGYGDFGFMDQFTGRQTPFKTPNLDQLASQSVAFSNGYATASVCAISRAGLLTGRHPEHYGLSFNIQPDDVPYEGFPVDQVLLQERLKTLGYSTAVIGKWHLGQHEQWEPQNQGVD
jgi:arylsulfatase A-like enzyme